MAKNDTTPCIGVDARRVNCPCGYQMLTAAPVETARAHNAVKHGGKYNIKDLNDDTLVPQVEKKEPPKAAEKKAEKEEVPTDA